MHLREEKNRQICINNVQDSVRAKIKIAYDISVNNISLIDYQVDAYPAQFVGLMEYISGINEFSQSIETSRSSKRQEL